MNFKIIVTTSGKKYAMDVERKYLMSDMERWEIKAKNHTFLLDCNRPLLAKKNLEHMPWDWSLVAGNCPQWFLKEIQQEIRKTLNWIDKS